MADKQLRFLLTAQDNASAKLTEVGKKGEESGNRIATAFTGLGSKIGGELGEILETVGEGMEKLGEHSETSGKKLIVAGSAITGLGAALQTMGSQDKAAEQQLKAAIDATGGSYEELEPKIKAVVSEMENYGHSAADTMGALQTLTTATGSGEKATEEMSVTADLAAAKHESLATAASQVAKILGGSGAKTLVQYGIHMQTTGDKTANAQEALDELSVKLKGQAAAAADTFSGKLDAIKTKATDAAAAFGAKFGGAITAAGPVIMGVGAIMETGIIQKSAKAAKSMLGIGAAATESAAETVAASATAAAAADGEAAAVEGAGRSMMIANPLFLAGAVVVGTLGAAWLSGKKAAADQAAAVENLTTAMEADSGAIGANVEAVVKKQLEDKNMLGMITKGGITVKQYTEALAGNTAGLTARQKAIVMLTNLDGKASDAVEKATEKSKESSAADELAKQKSDALKLSKVNLIAAQVKEGLSTDATTRKMQLANDAAGLLTASINKLNGAAVGAEQSEIAFKNSVANVTTAVKSNVTSLDINKQKGRDNTSAVLDAITAANNHAEAVAKRTGSVTKGTAALNSDITALKSAATKAGLNKGAIDKLITSYSKVPSTVKTSVELEGAAAAAAALDILNSKIHDRTEHIYSVVSKDKGYGNATATGAEYTRSGRYLVGEDGPEVVDMPQGAKVISNNRLPKGGSGGGGNVYVTVHVAGSVSTERNIVDAITTAMATSQRRNGRVVTAYGL